MLRSFPAKVKINVAPSIRYGNQPGESLLGGVEEQFAAEPCADRPTSEPCGLESPAVHEAVAIHPGGRIAAWNQDERSGGVGDDGRDSGEQQCGENQNIPPPASALAAPAAIGAATT